MGTVLFGKCFCRRQSLNYVLAKENRPQWHRSLTYLPDK